MGLGSSPQECRHPVNWPICSPVSPAGKIYGPGMKRQRDYSQWSNRWIWALCPCSSVLCWNRDPDVRGRNLSTREQSAFHQGYGQNGTKQEPELANHWAHTVITPQMGFKPSIPCLILNSAQALAPLKVLSYSPNILNLLELKIELNSVIKK